MRSCNFLFLPAIVGSVLAEASSGPAPVILNNVQGSCAMAKIVPNNATGSKLDVEVAVAAARNGKGVNVTLNINGGPGQKSSGYMYHIHEKPVPSNGDCAGTGGHLDPMARGESPPCNSRDPSQCQVGDLSGKFGNCTTLSGCSKSFQDPYLSLSPGNAAYIGDKSFVVHLPDKTRIGCANFAMRCTGKNPSSAIYPGADLTGGKSSSNASLPTGGNGTSGSHPTPKGTGAPASVPNAAAKVGAVSNAAMWAMLLPIGVAAL